MTQLELSLKCRDHEEKERGWRHSILSKALFLQVADSS